MYTTLVGAHLISAVHNNDDSTVPREWMLTPSSLQIKLKRHVKGGALQYARSLHIH